MSNNTENQHLRSGDLVLCIGAKGDIRTFSYGVDTSKLKTPAEEMDAETKQLIENGEKMFALAVACQQPQIMELLLQLTSDSRIIDFNAASGILRPN